MKRFTRIIKHATLIKDRSKDTKIKNLCDDAIESERILLSLFIHCRKYNTGIYYDCIMCKYRKLCVEYAGKFPIAYLI